MFLFPKGNSECQGAVDKYQNELVSPNEEETGFYKRYLEDFIGTLRKLCDVNWTRELEQRYIGTVE